MILFILGFLSASVIFLVVDLKHQGNRLERISETLNDFVGRLENMESRVFPYRKKDQHNSMLETDHGDDDS
jgi:hypothetical protein